MQINVASIFSNLISICFDCVQVPEDAWQNYMLHFDAGEGCGFQGCAIEDLEHFHCKDDGCETVFRKGDEYREHGRNHFIQDQVISLFVLANDVGLNRPLKPFFSAYF